MVNFGLIVQGSFNAIQELWCWSWLVMTMRSVLGHPRTGAKVGPTNTMMEDNLRNVLLQTANMHEYIVL